MKRIGYTTCIIVLLGMMARPGNAAAQTPSAMLNFFIDDVEVWSVTDENWHRARLNQKIIKGDSIRTGRNSRAEIKFLDGTVSRIDELSQIYIKEIKEVDTEEQGWQLILLIGKIWTNAVKLLSAESSRRIETPSTQAAIRGTVYRVDVDTERTTEVSVYEGSVEVRPRAQSTPAPQPVATGRSIAAVLPLTPAGLSSTDADALTDRLQTELLRRNEFALIMRGRVDELLQEQGWAESGGLTFERISEVGTLLNAGYVISGSVTAGGGRFTVDVRRIEVATGLIEGFSNFTFTGTFDRLLDQMSRTAADLAPPQQTNPGNRDDSQNSEQFAGPRRVSFQEWMTILDAMQRITVRQDGSRQVSTFSPEDEANDAWVQFNTQRDQALDLERNR